MLVSKSAGFVTGEMESATGIRHALEQIGSSSVPVIVVVIFETELAAVLQEADAQGLLGTDRAWIFVDLGYQAQKLAQADADHARRLHGTLAFAFSSVASQRYSDLARAWEGMTPESCKNDLFTPSPSMFTSEPPEAIALIYDAVVALSIALDNAANPFSSALVVNEFKGLSFLGASGQVQLEHSSGDRSDLGTKYALHNMVALPAGGVELRKALVMSSATHDASASSAPLNGAAGCPCLKSTTPSVQTHEQDGVPTP
jgi:hypothetical protein